jgi:hypothetical protein
MAQYGGLSHEENGRERTQEHGLQTSKVAISLRGMREANQVSMNKRSSTKFEN